MPRMVLRCVRGHADTLNSATALWKEQADARTRVALASLVFPCERPSRIRELKELDADAKAG
jgi:hypothetical protein